MSDKRSGRRCVGDDEWELDVEATPPLPDGWEGSAANALDLLIDGELKLLAGYDARQASADSRITALATAAIALPTLTLSLSTGLAGKAALLQTAYVFVVVAAAVVVTARAWNGWRRRPDYMTDEQLDATPTKGWRISAEAIAVTQARNRWRDYQRETAVAKANPIRVRQLALTLSRARARDSHKVAQIKDYLSVAAAIVFGIALAVSAVLVSHADFTA